MAMAQEVPFQNDPTFGSFPLWWSLLVHTYMKLSICISWCLQNFANMYIDMSWHVYIIYIYVLISTFDDISFLKKNTKKQRVFPVTGVLSCRQPWLGILHLRSWDRSWYNVLSWMRMDAKKVELCRKKLEEMWFGVFLRIKTKSHTGKNCKKLIVPKRFDPQKKRSL